MSLDVRVACYLDHHKVKPSDDLRKPTMMMCEDEDKNKFVLSEDSIFHLDIPKVPCGWFGNSPPLILGAKSDKQSLKRLKQKCHLSLPAHLRCAIWISSVARVANPQLPIQETDTYGSIGYRKSVESKWEYVLNAVFPNPTDIDDAIAPDLGLTQQALNQLIHHDYPVPEKGAKQLTLVLCAVQQVVGIEFSPLNPDIATLLLTHMPASYAYATIREMINDTSQYMPVSQKEYYSWCKTYEFYVKKQSLAHYNVMERCGALKPEGLDPIFKRFFTSLLGRKDVLHFMDIYLVEGCKAFFRLALSLIKLIPKSQLKSLNLTDSESFWNEIRKKTFHPDFTLEKHLSLMYPKVGKIAKRYPNRRMLRRALKYHEQWAAENMPIYVNETPPKPMGYIQSDNDTPVTLAKPTIVRSCLAKWLPMSLKTTKLDLIYSTEIHGRSLAAFYNQCNLYKNTIVLVEAIVDSKKTVTIGVFASHAWNTNPSSYGDGECFLFRASPEDPKCFHWTPDFEGIGDFESQAIREQFMVAKSDFLAMGANAAGTNGIRLDQDFIHGESHSALGFDNEPLPGEGQNKFDIGVVEAYRLIREVDGNAVGKEEKVWDLTGL